jgi:hypothetical protein
LEMIINADDENKELHDLILSLNKFISYYWGHYTRN